MLTIIKIEPHENGGHDNQTFNESFDLSLLPEDWAVLPEVVGTPDTLDNFPYGDITVEETDGVLTVTSWTPGTVPDPEPIPETEETEEPEVATKDDIQAVWDSMAAAYNEGVQGA